MIILAQNKTELNYSSSNNINSSDILIFFSFLDKLQFTSIF